MTLVLDERRRAMLAEFGIELPPTRPAADAGSISPAPANLAGKELVQETVQEQVQARAARAEPLPPLPVLPVAEPAPPSARAPSALHNGAIEAMDWASLQQAASECRACASSGTRRDAVLGAGDLQPDWLIVGDAPGESEEREGVPFAGDAGRLLDNMLRAVGLAPGHKVYVTNLLKCRLPADRNPEPDELAESEAILRRQVQLLRPRVLVVFGRFAVPALLGTTEPLGRLRGRRHEYEGVPVVVSYAPTYLLRSPADKAKAWADLCLAREIVNANAQPG